MTVDFLPSTSEDDWSFESVYTELVLLVQGDALPLLDECVQPSLVILSTAGHEEIPLVLVMIVQLKRVLHIRSAHWICIQTIVKIRYGLSGEVIKTPSSVVEDIIRAENYDIIYYWNYGLKKHRISTNDKILIWT